MCTFLQYESAKKEASPYKALTGPNKFSCRETPDFFDFDTKKRGLKKSYFVK